MNENTYSVSEINNYLKQLFDKQDMLRNVQVTGEISNFKRYPSGHCYFTLKDASSVLKCVMFRYKAASLRFEPSNGDTVLAVGHISVYERDGTYQLYTDLLLQQGAGGLMQAYEKLKEKLTQAGLFAAERKQALPVNPQRLGIITSPAGAAVRDIITVSRRRNPGIKLLLYPVQVQGEAASVEITAAIQFFNKHELADVLIVGRGGGSIEDLWAFNEERTVRAVAASKIPIVSAVGHETDFTLCDFAADKRAATPSQAAELAVADVAAYRRQLQHLTQRCHTLLSGRMIQEQHRLEAAVRSWVLQEPERIFAERELRVDTLTRQMTQAVQDVWRTRQHRLALAAAKLNSLSPLAVLSRGYSFAQTKDGRFINSIAQAACGDELVTNVQDGRIISLVQQVEGR